MARKKPRDLSDLLALPDDASLSEAEAGLYLNRSKSTMKRYRREGGGPPYYRIGAKGDPGYIKGDLRAYREKRRFRDTAHEMDEAARAAA